MRSDSMKQDAVVISNYKNGNTVKSEGQTMNNVQQYACLPCRCRPASRRALIVKTLFMVALCNRADHIYFHAVVSYGRPI